MQAGKGHGDQVPAAVHTDEFVLPSKIILSKQKNWIVAPMVVERASM